MIPIIIVPYRDREEHLKVFIPAIMECIPSGKIYVIEQFDNKLFNKGSLINIGYLESKHLGDYYMFHDVDTIPVEVDYSFPEFPTHLGSKMQQFNYKMPYPDFFGGCVLFQGKHFEQVNGFTNKIEGWGAEDDLFHDSFAAKGVTIDRRICTFNNLHHPRYQNPIQFGKNVDIWKAGRDYKEGVDTVKYDIHEYICYHNYVHLKVILKK